MGNRLCLSLKECVSVLADSMTCGRMCVCVLGVREDRIAAAVTGMREETAERSCTRLK